MNVMDGATATILAQAKRLDRIRDLALRWETEAKSLDHRAEDATRSGDVWGSRRYTDRAAEARRFAAQVMTVLNA